jgi:drug/metabolite transporter (DMT)-like permease
MLKHSFSIFGWLLDLFNAPPRASMTRRQKVGRILFVSGALLVLCILSAMLFAVSIFIQEKLGRALDQISDVWTTASIIIVGVVVNALCVFILFQVKKFDRLLMLGSSETSTRP